MVEEQPLEPAELLLLFPGFGEVNAERLESFLKKLPGKHRYVFELRNPTWHIDVIYRILSAYNAAFCIYHLAGFQTPLEITADFTYIRLHGPGGKYQGSYSDESLRTWAAEIRRWRRRLKQIYVYFDNDQEAFAPRNAIALKAMLNLST